MFSVASVVVHGLNQCVMFLLQRPCSLQGKLLVELLILCLLRHVCSPRALPRVPVQEQGGVAQVICFVLQPTGQEPPQAVPPLRAQCLGCLN